MQRTAETAVVPVAITYEAQTLQRGSRVRVGYVSGTNTLSDTSNPCRVEENLTLVSETCSSYKLFRD